MDNNYLYVSLKIFFFSVLTHLVEYNYSIQYL